LVIKLPPSCYFKTDPASIRLVLRVLTHFLLSLRNAEDLLHERDIESNHETVREW